MKTLQKSSEDLGSISIEFFMVSNLLGVLVVAFGAKFAKSRKRTCPF
jgi:hypothetical protein